MKGILTFGLVVCFFLVPIGCAHASDSAASTARQQEIAPAQTNVTPPAQANATPRVEVPETDFDFGLVSDGNDYLHVFKIRNTGTADLVIRKILPG
jgi:hypothetical protein